MDAESKRYIDRLFAHHARKMRNIVARGVVAMVDDDKKMQENQIKLLDGELIDGAERAQQYGFSSHPHGDAECFVVFVGADRGHPLVFSVDDRRYRLQSLEAGEVAIYTDEGDTITLKRGNTIEVKTKHFVVQAEEDAAIETKALKLSGITSISLETPQLAMGNQGGATATASIQGSLAASGDIQANGGAVSLRGHVHDGVQSGNGSSNKPVGG